MATVNLYLKDKSAGKTAIRAVINDGRNFQVKLYSGVSIKPKHWNTMHKCVSSANPNAVQLNAYLKEFTNRILSEYLKAKMAGAQVTTEYLKKVVWPEPEKVLTFWEVWQLFISSKEMDFAHQTFKKYSSLANHLKDFEVLRKQELNFNFIDEQLLLDLQTFFYSKQHLNTQSTAKYLGLLKSFLNWSLKRQHLTNDNFRFFKPISQPDTLNVIITNEELQKIEKAELGDKNYLINARELFVLSCLTGLRYSDYSRVGRQHHKLDNQGNYVVHIRQTKTTELVEIPLTPRANRVVKALISGKVHPITNQKMNKYLKKLCRIANVDEPFEVIKFVGKTKTTETKPKYELITSHTGRRTFATNLLEKGVPAETVMYFMGSKDYKTFSKYVNIPKEAQIKAVKQALTENDTVLKVI